MNKLKRFIYENKNNKFVVFIDKLIYRFNEHGLISAGGSLVYFIILSIFPFLIALLNVLNFTNLIGSEAVIELIRFLPDEISTIVMSFLSEVSATSSGELLSFSVILGFWSASKGIKQIIKNINIAYGFKEKRGFVKISFISIVFTIALAIMIVLLLLTQVFGKLILEAFAYYLGLQDKTTSLWKILNFTIPIAYMIFTFALLYKYSPSADKRDLLRKKTIVPGALFATFGTILVTKIFSFYVGNFANYSLTYGSLGGMIILLIWLWLMSIIILLGGEVNAVIFTMLNTKNGNYWPREESVLKNFLKDFHV